MHHFWRGIQLYNLKIDIAKTADGRNILYATDGKINRVGNVNVNSLKIKGSWQNSNSEVIVSEEEKKVKYSVSDSSGRQLSEGQREYFKDSKVRDENGALKPVYHGTNKEFSRFESVDGTYWFSEDVDYAEAMAEERSGSRIIEVYLDIKLNDAPFLEGHSTEDEAVKSGIGAANPSE